MISEQTFYTHSIDMDQERQIKGCENLSKHKLNFNPKIIKIKSVCKSPIVLTNEMLLTQNLWNIRRQMTQIICLKINMIDSLWAKRASLSAAKVLFARRGFKSNNKRNDV